jgi:hypothetical protein
MVGLLIEHKITALTFPSEQSSLSQYIKTIIILKPLSAYTISIRWPKTHYNPYKNYCQVFFSESVLIVSSTFLGILKAIILSKNFCR